MRILHQVNYLFLGTTKSDKLKFLWWDNNGFWLFYKRLEKGRFQLPKIIDAALELNKDQLSLLLAGVDFMNQSYLEKVTAQTFLLMLR